MTDYSYYSYCRKSTGREFFVPARTLIAVKLLSNILTKIDLFQSLSQTGLDHGVRCHHPLLAPPGLKVRAATSAEVVMAEEAALMVEALAIVTADADNIRQQTTIKNRLGAPKPCLAVATTEVSSWG